MGSCVSHIQSEQSNLDQLRCVEPKGAPSNWSRNQVISWLQTTDLTTCDHSKLYKKFKKHKIDGQKLLQLTDETLRETLKIHELRLRLELLVLINKEKSTENYPSPLHINKYQIPPLPPYYPFDYKYRLSLDRAQNEQHSIKDRLSWTIGTIVLIYDWDYDTWSPAHIIAVTQSHGWSLGMHLDYVTVIYELPNGIIARKKLNRFDNSSIKSDQRFMSNRGKLQPNCMVDVFDEMNHQWMHSYIKGLGSSNTNDFLICNSNNICGTGRDLTYLRYDRWSPKIRCSETLLNLTINSEIHVWNCALKSYCCAKIIEINDNNDGKLDIFKVIYKTQNGEYYSKFIHQFSANILLLNNNEQRPSHYTDLEVVMYSNYLSQSHSLIKHDITDERYCHLLLKGFLRRILSRSDTDDPSMDILNLLSMLMIKGNYIGYNYGLIMYLESIHW